MLASINGLTSIEISAAIVRDPVVMTPNTPVLEAIAQMSALRSRCQTIDRTASQLDELHAEIRSSCVLAIEHGSIVGILTERDVVRLCAQEYAFEHVTIGEVMVQPVITLAESALTDLFFAINLLQQHHIRHLPIVNERDRSIGLVTHESLRQIARPIDLLRLRTTQEVMTRQVVCTTADSSMLEIARLMADRQVSSVVIVQCLENDRQIPIGILTERDLVQCQALGLNLSSYQAGEMMSAPIFTVEPETSLLSVQQIMEQRFIRRLAVTGSQGELLGIVTQTSLLQAFQPIELYHLAEVLERKAIQLEAEKVTILENRAVELEEQVAARTVALQNKAEQEQLLADLATQIRSSLSLQTILDTTVEQVRQILKCDRANIWQFQADWSIVAVAESTDSSWSSIGHQVADTCAQSMEKLYAQGQIRVVPDIYTTPMSDCHRDLLIQLQTRSKILVPLMCGDKLWGLLNVSESEFARDWQSAEIELLRALSVHLAIALHQATSHQQLQAELKARSQAEARLAAQNILLAKIAKDEPLANIFELAIDSIEQYLHGASCSLMFVDEHNRLRNAATSNLPVDYVRAVEGIEIGEGVGSCGTAAWRREMVIVADIDTDPLWQNYRQIALNYGFKACWSSPVLGSDGRVLGTFGVYYPKIQSPTPEELETIVQMANMIGIAIEQKQNQLALTTSEARWHFALEGAGDGIWDWNIQNNTVFFSEQWKTMLGYANEEIGNTPSEWERRVHPEDLDRCYALLNDHFSGKLATYQNEQRILCRDGSYKWISARGKVLERTADGRPLRIVGTHTDITDRKQAETALQNLIEGTAATTGDDFFPVVVGYVAQALNVSYVFLSEHIDGQLQTLASWAHGSLQTNTTYQVAKTPCEIVLSQGKYYCGTQVQQSFPDDLDLVEMGANSYLGIALRNRVGRAIGNLCILDAQPIADPNRAENLLRVFAARATAELERERATQSLERLNQELEDKVVARTADLCQSQQFLQKVLDSFPLSVFWKDCNSVYLGCNRMFVADAGLTSTAEVVGKTDYEMPWGQTEADIYRADDRQTIESNLPTLGIVETQIQADGKQIWLETNKMPLHDLEGQTIGVLGTYQDITARKQAESQLQQQTRQKQLLWNITQTIRQSLELEIIVNTAVDEVRHLLKVDRVAVYRFSPDWSGEFIAESVVDGWVKLVVPQVAQTIWVDSYLQETQGGRFKNHETLTVSDIYQAELQSCHIELLEQFQARAYAIAPIFCGDILWGLFGIYQNDAPHTWTSWEIELLQQITSQLAIAIQQSNLLNQLQQELSEREQAQSQLTQRNEELARATRLKDEFLANMSHELRTPLNAILGMTEGLSDRVFGNINDRQIKALKTIERSGSHLLELINDILDVAKIESGHIELECNPTAVTLLCQSSLTFIKQQAHQKRITLATNIPPNLPDLWVDERRIRQVSINLLNNAVKFTPEGGRISLEVTHIQHNFLRIAITDTGIGISPADINKLFQPFIQIDSALNRQYQGTGLGLALVKRIVELHGGSVGLTSEVGVGSCFTIDLPCVDSAFTPIPEFQPQPTLLTATDFDLSQSLANTLPSILLAEDNEANIATISGYLEAKGYRLIVANSGREAIDLLQSEHPNLILMDIQMPGMDGLTAIQAIRHDPQWVDLPIIALTALAMSGDRERCLAAGANDYISKPIQLKQLAQTIHQMLNNRLN